MTAPAFSRRKTQIALLADACRQRRQARVSRFFDAAGRNGALAVRFLALEPDTLLLQWPLHGPGPIAPRNAAVEVRFQHGGRVLGFHTTTRGQVEYPRVGGGTIAAWKLALPLCIEARQPRQRIRVTADDAMPIPARCTSVTNLGYSFAARLHDLSTGGLRVRAGQHEAAWAQAGEVIWISLALPEPCGNVEFVARVLHVRACPPDGTVLLGCRFCPRDDSTAHDRQLAQLRALLSSAPHRHPAGGTPCS